MRHVQTAFGAPVYPSQQYTPLTPHTDNRNAVALLQIGCLPHAKQTMEASECNPRQSSTYHLAVDSLHNLDRRSCALLPVFSVVVPCRSSLLARLCNSVPEPF